MRPTAIAVAARLAHGRRGLGRRDPITPPDRRRGGGPAARPTLRPHSDAECALYRLHGPFERFAESHLFADERLLALVPWSAATSETRLRRLSRLEAPGSRQAIEGVMLVTDRQVFLL